MEEYYEGGHSVCRNPVIQKMFVFLGIGEKGGTGADVIAKGWRDNGWSAPTVVEKSNPDRIETYLKLKNDINITTKTPAVTTETTSSATETFTGTTETSTETSINTTETLTDTTETIFKIIRALCRFVWVTEVVASIDIIYHIYEVAYICIASCSSFG